MATPKFAIIILNWNGLEYTKRCVASLLRDPDLDAPIYVLDNGSDRDEAATLRQIFGDRFIIERSDRNLGFAGGNNVIIRHALADQPFEYVVCLNQDTEVELGCLQKLAGQLDQYPRVAVGGPLVLNTNDTVQSAGATINHWTGKIVSHYQGESQAAVPVAAQPVDCVIGNCFMIRTTAWKTIGQFDERYFAYYEEADWCTRARHNGWQCMVVPTAVIHHAKTSGFRTYWITRNMIWFQKKYAAWWQCVYFSIYFWVRYIPERLIKGSHWRDLWRGAKDGWI